MPKKKQEAVDLTAMLMGGGGSISVGEVHLPSAPRSDNFNEDGGFRRGGGYGERGAERTEREYVPSRSDEDNAWRSRPAKPAASNDYGSRGGFSEHRRHGGGYDESNRGYSSTRRSGFDSMDRRGGFGDSRVESSTSSRERPRLNLTKRTKPIEVAPPVVSKPRDEPVKKPRANPFGNAKIVDTKDPFEYTEKKAVASSSSSSIDKHQSRSENANLNDKWAKLFTKKAREATNSRFPTNDDAPSYANDRFKNTFFDKDRDSYQDRRQHGGASRFRDRSPPRRIDPKPSGRWGFINNEDVKPDVKSTVKSEPLKVNSRWKDDAPATATTAVTTTTNVASKAKKPSIEELKKQAAEKNRVKKGGRSDEEIESLINAVSDLTIDQIHEIARTGDPKLTELQLKKIQSLTKEFLDVKDVKEAVLCIEELNLNVKNQEMAETLRRICHVTLDSMNKPQWGFLGPLCVALKEKNVLSSSDAALGLQLVRNELQDIAVDVPLAPEAFDVIEKNLIGLGIVDCVSVTPERDFEWWTVDTKNNENNNSDNNIDNAAPTAFEGTLSPAEYSFVSNLLNSGKLGSDLLEAAKLMEPRPSALQVAAGTIHYLIDSVKDSKNYLSLISTNEEDEDEISILTEDSFGGFLEAFLYHTTEEKQIQCVFEMQAVLSTIGFPKIGKKSFIETLFMTLYDAEILPEEAFLGWWKDDETANVSAKKVAVAQCSGWLTWLESNAGDSDDD